jgi:hypothetical protein
VRTSSFLRAVKDKSPGCFARVNPHKRISKLLLCCVLYVRSFVRSIVRSFVVFFR